MELDVGVTHFEDGAEAWAKECRWPLNAGPGKGSSCDAQRQSAVLTSP